MKIFNRLRKPKPLPREYLYVDEKRLNSYLEQISSKTTYNKAPSLQLNLSVVGISVRAGQTAHFRDKTNHEKVCELIEYLNRYRHLGNRRPGLINRNEELYEYPDFILEECEAVRVIIPAVRKETPVHGVVVWVSEWPLHREINVLQPPGLLCVIQDTTFDDARYREGFSHSGYTWLQALLLQLSQEPIDTKLSSEYPLTPIGEYHFDLMSAQDYLQDEMSLFRPDPLGWLGKKGCTLSLARQIQVLYRIRNIGSDEIGTKNRREDFTVSTFAYGIAIWAAPSKGNAPDPKKLAGFS